MKIDSSYTNPLQSQKPESTQGVEKLQRPTEGVTQTQTSQRDTLEISDKARLLSKARVALDETPEVNSNKVEELKETIRQGNYQIPYEGLANKLAGTIDITG